MRRILPSILILSTCLFLANPQIAAKKAQGKISSRLEKLLESQPFITYRVWVYFTDRGELDASNADEVLAKAKISERALKRRMNRSRGPIIDKNDLPVSVKYISSLRELGCRIRYPSKYLNAVSILATGSQVEQIARLPFVKKIERVYSLRRKKEAFQKLSAPPIPRSSFDDNGAFSAKSFYGPSFKQLDLINIIPLHEIALHGEGVLIAMLDTGFNLHHAAFSNIDVIAQWDFVNNDSITEDEPGDPPGQDNHGTFTLSAIGGYAPGSLIGPAWGASFVLAKTEQIDVEIQIEEDDWVRGIEWAESLGVDIASSSLGYYDWYSYADMDGNTAVTTIAADIAASKGVTVVTAAGNAGPLPWPGIIAPSDGDSVIAVGAVDSFGVVASFSSRGPSYDGRTKPDLAAMGVSVVSAASWDSIGFVRVSGTSLSTPLLAGACALLLQMYPYWTPMKVLEELRNAASYSSSPNNNYGWGVINAHASALNGSTSIGNVMFDFTLNGNNVSIRISISTGQTEPLDLLRHKLVSESEGTWSQFELIEEDFIVNSSEPYTILEKNLSGGVYDYRLRLHADPNIYTDDVGRVLIPFNFFVLSQSYPNPFSPSSEMTSIEFVLGGKPIAPGTPPSESWNEYMDVSLEIFDVMGRKVKSIVDNEFLGPGKQKIRSWDGRDDRGSPVASGVYFYQLRAGGQVISKKLVVINR